jgi:hypothetical protein
LFWLHFSVDDRVGHGIVCLDRRRRLFMSHFF